jgi:hypothetical protein
VRSYALDMQRLRGVGSIDVSRTLPPSKPFERTTEEVDFDPRQALAHAGLALSVPYMNNSTGPLDGYIFSRFDQENCQPSVPRSPVTYEGCCLARMGTGYSKAVDSSL